MRTLLAAFFGVVAMVLILASILVVWLNRTLLDTNTYVNTVAPLANQVDVQTFLANKATDQLLANAPTQDLAKQLLPASEVTGRNDVQLLSALRPVLNANFLKLLSSSDFAALWKSTNRNAHEQLLSQLNSGGSEISLDLSPAVNSLLVQIKTTQLAPISDKIKLDPASAKVDLKGSSVDKVYHYYRLFKQFSLVLVAATLLAILLCAGISVQHGKTLRRIVISTGVLSLLLAFALETPTFIAPSLTDAASRATAAIAEVLLHNLQVAMVILATLCFLIAIVSKLVSRRRTVTGAA